MDNIKMYTKNNNLLSKLIKIINRHQINKFPPSNFKSFNLIGENFKSIDV